jgi:hypothetical protein
LIAGDVPSDWLAAIATLINALDKAQDRVRIHRGKPLPSAGDAKRGRKLTGKPVGAVIELQELKRIEQAQPEPEPEPEPEPGNVSSD